MKVEIEAVSGDSVTNAKSLLGLMTLDLSRPVQLRIEALPEEKAKVFHALSPYLVMRDAV